jgi:hypothetical protein
MPITVRRGLLRITEGPDVIFEATLSHPAEVRGLPELEGRIAVMRDGGFVEFLDPDQLVALARKIDLPLDLVAQAFGHMMGEAPEETAPTGRQSSKGRRRPRNLRIGYIDPVLGPRLGSGKGSLILFHPKTQRIVWGGIEEAAPLSGHVNIRGIDVHWRGGIRRGSRLVGFDAAMRSATKAGIPIDAFLTAFGHMIDLSDRQLLSRGLGPRAAG